MNHAQYRLASGRCCSVLAAIVLLFILPLVEAARTLHIAAPLQALTLWDPQAKDANDDTDNDETPPSNSFRGRFLPKFRAGLRAEVDTATKLEEDSRTALVATTTTAGASSSSDWASKAAQSRRNRTLQRDQLVEAAYDAAVAPYQTQQQSLGWFGKHKKKSTTNPNKYQFVGVVQPSSSSSSSSDSASNQERPPIVWYARPKPAQAQWSVRLVHVNRAAILKDLFRQGKIDVFGRYEAVPNKMNINSGEEQSNDGRPDVRATYSVRERSLKTLWNFSPRRFFRDSSGLYWRERRLREGWYTDGTTVYEATYRYADGRNGMHRLATLDDLMASRAVSEKTKAQVKAKLQKTTDNVPDVVLEE